MTAIVILRSGARSAGIDPHGNVDVFDRDNDKQRPNQQGEDAQRRSAIDRTAAQFEHSLHGVKRAGPDITEDDTCCADHQRRKLGVRFWHLPTGLRVRALRAYGLLCNSASLRFRRINLY